MRVSGLGASTTSCGGEDRKNPNLPRTRRLVVETHFAHELQSLKLVKTGNPQFAVIEELAQAALTLAVLKCDNDARHVVTSKPMRFLRVVGETTIEEI